MSWFAFWGKKEEPKVNPLEAALLELEGTRKKLELMESVTARQLEYMRSELERAREEFAKAQAQVEELRQKAEQAQQTAQQAQQTAEQAEQAAEQAQQKAEDAQQQAQQDVQIPPTTEPKKKKGLFGRISSYLKELIDKEYEEIKKEEGKYQKKGKKDEKYEKVGEKEDKKGGGGGEREDGRGEARVGEGVMGKLNVVQAEVKQEGVNVKVESDSKKDKDKGERDNRDKGEKDRGDKADDKTKTTVGFTQSLAAAVEGFSQAGSGLYKMSRALFGNMAVLPVALGKAVGRAVGDAMVGMWNFLEKAPIIGGVIGSVKNFMGGVVQTARGLVKGVSGIAGAIKSVGGIIPSMIVDGLLKLGVMVVDGIQDLGFYLGKVFFDLKNAVLSFLSSSYKESLQQAKDKASKMPSRLSGEVSRDSFVKPISVPRGGGGSVSGAIYQLSKKQRDMLRAQEAQGLEQFRGGMEYREDEAEEDTWGGPELRYDAEQDEFVEVQAAMRQKPTMVRTSRTFSTFAPPPRQYQYVEGRFAPPRPSRPPVERERRRDKQAEQGAVGGEAVQAQVQTRAERRRERREKKREEAAKRIATTSKALNEAFQLLSGNMMAIATMLASTAQILANIPKGTTIPTPPGGGGGGGGTPP